MFIDASAMVAMLTGEPDSDAMFACLDKAIAPTTSALAIFETVMALSRKKAQSVADSEAQLLEFVRLSHIAIVPLSEQEGIAAIGAFRRYGKGQGHPAQLNMGDCFAYACAQVHDLPLLFVGNDFVRTDIRSAMA